MLNIQDRAGWVGAFTRDEAPGALPNGSRVWKVESEPGDRHPIGSMATVLGSLHSPELGFAYFVEWDALPRYAVLVVASKIADERSREAAAVRARLA